MRASAIVVVWVFLIAAATGCSGKSDAESAMEPDMDSVSAVDVDRPVAHAEPLIVEPDRNTNPLTESPVHDFQPSPPLSPSPAPSGDFVSEPVRPPLPAPGQSNAPGGDPRVRRPAPSFDSGFEDPLSFSFAPGNNRTVEPARNADLQPSGAGAPFTEPSAPASAMEADQAPKVMQQDSPVSQRDDHALTEVEGDQYSTVTVYYGTDRKPLEISESLGSLGLRDFKTPLAAAGIMLILAFLTSLAGRKRASVGVVAVGLLVSLGLCAVVIQSQLRQTIGPDVQLQFGAKRGELQLGVCRVSIPHSHRVGELESSSILRLEFRPDERKHVVLMDAESKTEAEFYDELRASVAQSTRKETFVFVHGYNVSFTNAARRTAQIAHDLKFDGVPIFYSWPSQASVFGYTIDESNVTWTVPHLKRFLASVAEQSGAESIHLIAHSMGNRAMTTALKELTYERQDGARLFNQLVLAAPDIDAEVFRRDIAPIIQRTAQRVTLYASSNDQALLASKQVHGHARAGDSGEGLVVIPGIETVDVSAVDTSFLGHSYYGDNNSIIADMYQLIQNKLSASGRRWLRPMLRDGQTYWIFDSADKVASPGSAFEVR